jgi:hypothetical protein
MKCLHILTLAVTIQAFAIPQQAPAASYPTSSPWLQAPGSVGNALSNGYALFQYLATTLGEARDELPKGVPAAEVVDKTIPKLLEEAKLHNRVQLASEDVLRSGAKKARATFGPFKLVGKNVRYSRSLI